MTLQGSGIKMGSFQCGRTIVPHTHCMFDMGNKTPIAAALRVNCSMTDELGCSSTVQQYFAAASKTNTAARPAKILPSRTLLYRVSPIGRCTDLLVVPCDLKLWQRRGCKYIPFFFLFGPLQQLHIKNTTDKTKKQTLSNLVQFHPYKWTAHWRCGVARSRLKVADLKYCVSKSVRT